MKKKKLTRNQEEWKKELNRLNQFIRRAKKRGYFFPEDIIPETPNRITAKKLKIIKSLKPDVLYSKAEYYDAETRTFTSGTKGRKIERKKAAQKGLQTKQRKARLNLPREVDVVLKQIEQMIAEWQPFANWSEYFTQMKKQDKLQLSGMLESAILSESRVEVARRLQQVAEHIIDVADRILYSSDEEQVELDLVYFATILKGRALTAEESMNFTEQAETNEQQEL